MESDLAQEMDMDSTPLCSSPSTASNCGQDESFHLPCDPIEMTETKPDTMDPMDLPASGSQQSSSSNVSNIGTSTIDPVSQVTILRIYYVQTRYSRYNKDINMR